MWSLLNKLLLWGIFSSVSFQKTILDCDTLKRPNDFSSPSLNSSTHAITTGQNVSLTCSHKNTSLPITYSLFLHTKHLETKEGKGKPGIFYLTIFKANDSGPYKCKAKFSNCSKYSPKFYFTVDDGHSCPSRLLLLPLLIPVSLLVLVAIVLVCLIPKWKARKATRENVPEDPGDLPMGGALYENVCKDQAGAQDSQEIQYVTPVFRESARREPGEPQLSTTDVTEMPQRFPMTSP